METSEALAFYSRFWENKSLLLPVYTYYSRKIEIPRLTLSRWGCTGDRNLNYYWTASNNKFYFHDSVHERYTMHGCILCKRRKGRQASFPQQSFAVKRKTYRKFWSYRLGIETMDWIKSFRKISIMFEISFRRAGTRTLIVRKRQRKRVMNFVT